MSSQLSAKRVDGDPVGLREVPTGYLEIMRGCKPRQRRGFINQASVFILKILES